MPNTNTNQHQAPHGKLWVASGSSGWLSIFAEMSRRVPVSKKMSYFQKALMPWLSSLGIRVTGFSQFLNISGGLGRRRGWYTHGGWCWHFSASPILISPFLARAEGSVSPFKSNGLNRNPQGSRSLNLPKPGSTYRDEP